ncbi:hypothetical protein M5K25_024860 [Dendrobium thyrsiflorum]|uniref:Uncharacterized protein n=1 Tax=Dendrobium thyrsiflorum TaxID=117978 RepID=A0ABD0U3A2_DENTH
MEALRAYWQSWSEGPMGSPFRPRIKDAQTHHQVPLLSEEWFFGTVTKDMFIPARVQVQSNKCTTRKQLHPYEGNSTNFGAMAAKKVDALEERLEGEMNQIKTTVEERMSSMEGQVANLRDMIKKINTKATRANGATV